MAPYTLPEHLHKLIDNLSYSERDQIYRYLWSEHVTEDVKSLCDDNETTLTNDAIEHIVNQYVYDGEYDCNLSYWDKLQNLIYRETHT